MKYLAPALVLIAGSTAVAAQDQTSNWQVFEEDGGRSGATVTAANGAQLVLKCDKPGRREVHAIVLISEGRLAVPNSRPVSRPINFRFNDGAPRSESWGFYEKHAIAQGKTSDRALPRFIAQLRNASKVHLRMDTGIGQDIETEFNVTGASETIAKVYELCKDSAPT